MAYGWISYEDGSITSFDTREGWYDELFRLGITNPGPEGTCSNGLNGNLLQWGTDSEPNTEVTVQTVLNMPEDEFLVHLDTIDRAARIMGERLTALQEAGREVIRAANRNPDDGPTGWAEAMSVLSNLVFPLDDSEDVEHEDGGTCCECGGSHTCQDCPTFQLDGPIESDVQ